MVIGVLAMQGAYKEHINILQDLDVSPVEIRNKNDLQNIDGIIIPGGESTTMGKLIRTLDIYDDLKDSFKGKIDYLNIYQEGGVLFVKYTNSVGAKKVEKNFENIYASKDGVIQKIDVSSGNILVKLNQYVKKGDLLVSNTITSTSEVDKIIETEGTIKAYTYTTYEAKIDKKKMDDGEAFSYLLHTIRSKLGSIDKIDREKVLSYGIIDNKRVLKVQYILIEDIASKEEN